MKQDIIKTLKIVSLALVITLGINYIYAWTGPTATPPGNNTATPINAGPVNQVKVTGTGTGNNGGLSLGVLTVQGKSLFQDTIQIAGGTPGVGKVLTATDSSGNATWRAGIKFITPTVNIATNTANTWHTVTVSTYDIPSTSKAVILQSKVYSDDGSQEVYVSVDSSITAAPTLTNSYLLNFNSIEDVGFNQGTFPLDNGVFKYRTNRVLDTFDLRIIGYIE